MNIELNGETYTLDADCTIEGLLERLEQSGRIAVEVNLEIIPRSQHASTLLSAGDRVEIVRAIGGG